MTLTLDIDSILDRVYADSAIGAVLRLRDPGRPVPMLTPDRRQGLRRIVVQASSILAGMTGIRMRANLPDGISDSPSTITAELPGDEHESTGDQLISAIALKTLALSAAISGDTVFAEYADKQALETIGQISDDRPFETRLSY